MKQSEHYIAWYTTHDFRTPTVLYIHWDARIEEDDLTTNPRMARYFDDGYTACAKMVDYLKRYAKSENRSDKWLNSAIDSIRIELIQTTPLSIWDKNYFQPEKQHASN